MSKHHPPKLSDADLTKRLNKKDYFDQLIDLQAKLARIQQAYLFHGLKGVLVFEGWDAAGAIWTPERAHRMFKDIIGSFEAPPIDAGIREELETFVARRKAEGGAPTDF